MSYKIIKEKSKYEEVTTDNIDAIEFIEEHYPETAEEFKNIQK